MASLKTLKKTTWLSQSAIFLPLKFARLTSLSSHFCSPCPSTLPSRPSCPLIPTLIHLIPTAQTFLFGRWLTCCRSMTPYYGVILWKWFSVWLFLIYRWVSLLLLNLYHAKSISFKNALKYIANWRRYKHARSCLWLIAIVPNGMGGAEESGRGERGREECELINW